MSKRRGDIEIIPKLTRNISIISHVDHGKTTMTDYLLASGGLLPEFLAGTLRALDSLPEEQRRGITIESSLATYFLNINDKEYLINLIDTPGHVDFSGKVAESLRLVDGSIIIVDAVEGIMAQTKSVLRQAIKEQITFILFINKIDRLVKELELNPQQIQLRIQKIIGDIQNLSINLGLSYNFIPNFSKGTVLLGSALDGWALDIDYVKNGKTINDIIEMYNKNNLVIEKGLKLSDVLNKAIINYFPNPIIGQNNKFPKLLKNKISDDTLKLLTACDVNEQPIILIGRQERTEKNMKNSFICRILSGSVKKGDLLFSSLNKENIKVINTTQFQGKQRKSIRILKAGEIGSISFSKHLTPGDIILDSDIESVILNDISYIQDPVVAVSIEPLKIDQIGKLQRSVEEICQYTPGLFFDLNKESGELLLQGVGTLQLDVLVNDLRALNYEIEVSPPKIISYEIPLSENANKLEDYSLTLTAGRFEKMKDCSNYKISITDDQNNHLLLLHSINNEGIDGLKEVFKHMMRISPSSHQRVKGLFICVENDLGNLVFSTYENAMIVGSKIIKNALMISKARIHEPYYDIEVLLPENYIGIILQELQRIDAVIKDVISDRDDSIILASISVREAIRMADRLRQLSDGNAFWSFPRTQFLPIAS